MDELDSVIGEVLDGLQPKLKHWSALLGDGTGVVEVPGMLKRVYCRMPDGLPAVVYNDRVPLSNDLAVVIGYDYINPKLLQVLGQREAYADDESGGFASPGLHHASHEFLASHGGQDVVYVQGRQIMPNRLSVITGLTVGVYNSPVRTSTGWDSAALWTLDLTSNVPGSGARYVLVGQDVTGKLVAIDGASASNRTYLRWSNIPTPTANLRPLAAVVLAAGQTDLLEDRTRNDFVDLRFLTATAWPVLSTVNPDNVASAAAPGSTLVGSPSDHIHKLNVAAPIAWDGTSIKGTMSAVNPEDVKSAAAPGDETVISPANHVHRLNVSAPLFWSGTTLSSTGGGSGGSVSAPDIAITRWSGITGQSVFALPDYVDQMLRLDVGNLEVDPFDYALSADGASVILTAALLADVMVSALYTMRLL